VATGGDDKQAESRDDVSEFHHDDACHHCYDINRCLPVFAGSSGSSVMNWQCRHGPHGVEHIGLVSLLSLHCTHPHIDGTTTTVVATKMARWPTPAATMARGACGQWGGVDSRLANFNLDHVVGENISHRLTSTSSRTLFSSLSLVI
jgi:hypothetical protein